MKGELLPAVAAATVLGAAGAVAVGLAGATTAVALPAGLGIGLLVWAAHTVTDRLTRPSDAEPPSASAGTGPVRTDSARPEPPPDAKLWLERASAAAGRLDRHRRENTSPALTEALTTAVTFVRGAADELHARAEAVRVIDAAAADTDHEALRHEQRRLKKEAEASRGAMREAKEASARAIGERADSLARLAELREVLMATLESTVLRLEAAADRGSLLVSLHAAGDATASEPDLTSLEHELEAVQAGLDRLDEISRSLHDTGPARRDEG
ncbi:hypothetical protein ACFVGN_38890 [Streptomyces sp. NPDC057757]|uniref:hypothetical protein n=1 Tax=Streptomyces sp. NPDC057757 TaxID=3346241 RepID=UPI0036A2BBCA